MTSNTICRSPVRLQLLYNLQVYDNLVLRPALDSWVQNDDRLQLLHMYAPLITLSWTYRVTSPLCRHKTLQLLWPKWVPMRTGQDVQKILMTICKQTIPSFHVSDSSQRTVHERNVLELRWYQNDVKQTITGSTLPDLNENRTYLSGKINYKIIL